MTDSDCLTMVAEANAGVEHADYGLREAVVAARLAGHTWTEIGRVLGTSRQAATERFSFVEPVAKAWQQVETLLHQATDGDAEGDSMAAVLTLSEQGLLHPLDVGAARELLEARTRTVHARDLSHEDAERVTELAIPLTGNLYSIVHRPSGVR